jgi:hypothetical protein
MILIGKQGCPRCKMLRVFFPTLEYIELPDKHFGLGDTICAFTSFFGITPCTKCQIRRNWFNKIIPYAWNKRFPGYYSHIKSTMLLSDVKTFPFFMDDLLTRVLKKEELPACVSKLLY